ncbi:endonuclease III domain-containing protein [Hymenobacter cellulosivorans]|uniref:Fe-S cluster assembly protein HesB n=1 Tax=Hymenobacter cellulosivorans TaxID=2932249 RepID=A0ABY4FGD2_9BACT|nr:Fe-S cluster assembly protein HesB [Hymenobacter cellulosivorans]UOQ55068.1 Fe-S cluster assembly protein HesB [Hymenobacter cellulosivorans]
MEPTSAVCTDFASCQARALRAHERLCAEYGAPFRFFSTKDPLSELISALLSHRTRNQESHRAYQQLRAEFPTWEEVRDAPTAAVEQAISACTWPEQKAPRIQAVLREISERCGGPCDLTFLAEKPIPEARAWLESISGVGPKTSAATLLFSSLRLPAMPVDSHHHRVAQRLGLIGPKVGEGPAHKVLAALLPPDWDAQQVYDHHEALMFHGQKCCYFHSPACARCVVLDQCPFGQARLGKPAPTPPAA